MHATWGNAEGGPQIVHAFLPRSESGYRVVDTGTRWACVRRADDVVLNGAFVPDRYIAGIVPVGQVDPFVPGVVDPCESRAWPGRKV